jgi:hypothetical protein
MPRGGKRPGAGRPRGSSSKKAKVSAALAPAIGMKPLDIMIAIMRRYYSEERLDQALEAAKALAPYFSQKFAPTDQPAVPHLEQGLRCSPISRTPVAAPRGKKELALLDAERGGEGTEWGDDFRRLNL